MLLEIAAILLGLAYFAFRSQQRPKGFPPGPNGIPILGYAPYLGTHPHITVGELSKQYGKIYSIFLGNIPIVILNDVNDIKKAWKSDIFSGRPRDKLLGMEVVPNGIVFDEGPSWVEQRRFSVKVLRDLGFGKKSMDESIQDEVRDLIAYFRARAGKPINPRFTIQISMINALWMIIASEKFSLDDPRAMNLQRIVHEGFIEPEQNGAVFFFPWFAKMFPKLTGFRKVLTAVVEMDEVLRKAIKEHEKTLTDEYSRDFIDVSIKKIHETDDPNSSFYKEVGIDNLINTLSTFFTAGSDTLTSSMSYMILYMVNHPEIMGKVQAEIDQVVGHSRMPSLNDRPNMPYMEAMLSEVLRHSSILHGSIYHSVMEDTVFEGFHLPKRTIVMSNLYLVHHSEELWSNPEEFSPERFLSPEGTFKKNDNLIPFSVGKRVCPAENVAMAEFFVYTAGLLQNFTFKEDPNQPLPSISQPKQALVLSPLPFSIIMEDRK